MTYPADAIHVTEDNIDGVRETMAATDQAEDLMPGCVTWAIYYGTYAGEPGDQRGQMTVWPNGRGAVCHGGDSMWGEINGELLYLDDGDHVYNFAGEEDLLND